MPQFGLFGAPRRLPQIDPALGQMMAREQGILPGERPSLGQPPQVATRKPGFFGQGGAGRAIAGTIGDVLLQQSGMAPIYGPAQQQAQAMAAALRQQSLERDQDWQDWVRKQEYERANPMPSTAQPYRFEDNAGNVWEVGPGGEPRRIFTDTVPRFYVQGDQAVQIGNPYVESAQRRTIGGKTYEKRGSDWFEVGDAGGNASGGFPGQ